MGEDNQNQTGIPVDQTQATPQATTTPPAGANENVGTPETQPQNPETANPTPQQPMGQGEQPTSVVQPAKGEGFLGKIAKLFKR